jgi:hypothetical protein
LACGNGFFVVKAYVLNEFLAQFRTEDVPLSVDDASGRLYGVIWISPKWWMNLG